MKPKVICHIMGSADGRLLPDRWTPPFGGTNPGELFGEYAAIGKMLDTDAWMFGKSTTTEIFPEKFISGNDKKATGETIHKNARQSERLFITVDPEGDILFTSNKLRESDILTVLGTNTTEDYLEFLNKKGISYIVLTNPLDLPKVTETIGKEFGIRSISLQGGGIINGAMLAAGLIDELSLVMYPGIDGLSDSPSIFEYSGASDERPAAGQTLELMSAETRKHGLIWLRYKFHHK